MARFAVSSDPHDGALACQPGTRSLTLVLSHSATSLLTALAISLFLFRWHGTGPYPTALVATRTGMSESIFQRPVPAANKQRAGLKIAVLPIDIPEPPQLRFAHLCCSPDTADLSQYGGPVILEQYVRGLPEYVEDPRKADIVFVPFYPILYGLHQHFPGDLQKTSDALSAQLVPAIQRLPNSTVLVFVQGHVDGYRPIELSILRHIRPTHPRRIVMLRTDMGDTLCGCFARKYWGDGLENVQMPYAVIQPPEFISQKARSKAKYDKNITVFFNAGRPGAPQSRRTEIVAGFEALKRPDIIVRIGAHFKHGQYVDALLHSKFCLVPEGDVSTSLRLFEAIVAKCVPVIISDCMDVPFEFLPPIGDYSSFAVKVPISSGVTDIMRTLDYLMRSGGYGRLMSRLERVWPYFTFHNGSLSQPTAAELIMGQVYDAAHRMISGLLPRSNSEGRLRGHC